MSKQPLLWNGQSKGIIIGKGGKMLKQIGTKARQDIEYLLDDKVYLELWVKVQKDWRDKNLFTRFWLSQRRILRK